MFQWIGSSFKSVWGPLRLLESYFFLAAFGFLLGVVLTWILLPKLWHLLPTDKGRAHAVGAEKSVGKPVSAGVIFITLFSFLCLLICPVSLAAWGIIGCVLAAMFVGYLDDASGGYHEYTLAIVDAGIAVAGAYFLNGFVDAQLWLPFYSEAVLVPWWINFPVSVGVIWIAINALNCTDGVDGLSGTLAAMSLLILAILLYLVVGNVNVSEYLLVVHNTDGANWSLFAITMVGCLAGYLWYNAPPSQVLMGDSGSRPIGFLVGVLVVATNNPFVIFVVSLMILINGATGLLKVAVIRFLKIGIFNSVRFPLHDHCRKNLNWSNSQVLLRFALLHLFFSTIFLALLLKVR